MDLRHLSYVVALARHRSFTAAAASLHVAQPSLSAQVRGLERELGVQLFERTTRHVGVTPAGSAFVEQAQRILAEVAAMTVVMAEHAGGVRGTVRLGAWFSVNPPLPWLLAGFVQQCPQVKIEVREENSDVMLDMLRAGDLDVALMTLCAGLDFRGIERAVYLEEPFVLQVAPRSNLAGAGEVTLQQIADEPLIMQKPGSALRRLIEQSFSAIGRVPHVVVETSQTAAIRDLVSAGIGSAIVPQSLAGLPGLPVRIIRIAEPPVRVSMLTWRRDNRTSAIAAFVAYARSHLPA